MKPGVYEIGKIGLLKIQANLRSRNERNEGLTGTFI
jgi:hypothetical protein